VRTTGLLPLSPDLLHRAHPTIFRSAKAAEHAIARNGKLIQAVGGIDPQNRNRGLLSDFGVYRFRRIEQPGRDARIIVDRTRWPNDAALIAAIEAFAGPLQSFQGVSVQRDDARSCRDGRPARHRLDCARTAPARARCRTPVGLGARAPGWLTAQQTHCTFIAFRDQ
jgi:hypothetical protein